MRDDNPTDDLTWRIPTNYFAHYYDVMSGYHPGEDWNLTNASNSYSDADLGQPVFAIGNGFVVQKSNLDSLGDLVVVQHTGSFSFAARARTEAGHSYTYAAERVSTLYSVYLHIVASTNVTNGSCVTRDTVLGHIMNPGGGPHLHFEIRHPDEQHSGDWSLVLPSSNWVPSDTAGHGNGYYKDVQRMVECASPTDCSGMRSPSDLIAQYESTPNLQITREPGASGILFHFLGQDLTRGGQVRLLLRQPYSASWLALDSQLADSSGNTSWSYFISCNKYGIWNAIVQDEGNPNWIKGDLNGDGIVNSLDYSILQRLWFTNDPNADLNHDGLVNAVDFSIMNSNWFKQSPVRAAAFYVQGCNAV